MDATWETAPYISPKSLYQPPLASTDAIDLIPIGLYLFAFAIAVITELANGRPLSAVVPQLGLPGGDSLILLVLIALAATALSVGLTIYACRRRELTLSATTRWTLATLPFGLAGPLIVVAICPRLAFDDCPRCNRKRRVDREKCAHCLGEWESQPLEGIELIDRSTSRVRAHA